MSAQSPELQNQIATWRMKAVEGTLSLEEMRDAIRALREGRIAASASPKAKSSKAPPRSVDDMLSELDGL